MKNVLKPLWLIILLTTVILLFAAIYHSEPAHGQTIPLDKAVITGKLPNGFTYIIRHNGEPKNRVIFYLVNKVGSVLEDEDQRGLAHFMEHMSFNGTTHFPKNELVNYLQKSGVRFGADLNAYTGFDETVYELPLPSDDPEILKNGIQIMRDWAQDATLDPAEIDKERGVVLEEKRLGKGAGERLQRQYYPLILNNSRYASRIPIGIDQVLNNFKPEAIRRFYKNWYRPDLQALIVVGDIDAKKMEQIIKAKFADLKNPVQEKPRTKYTVPLTGKNHFIVLTDKELTSLEAEVIIKSPGSIVKTEADYRASIVKQLFNNMLQLRLNELLRQPNPPFIRSAASISSFMGGLDVYNAKVAAKPGELEKGFKALWCETERVKRFGFTQMELDRVKKSFLSTWEATYQEKDKTVSSVYVNRYVKYFLSGTASPDIDQAYNLAKKYISTIGLSDVNNVATKYITSNNRDILITGPNEEKAQLPNEAIILKWIKTIEEEKLGPYSNEKDTGNSLLKFQPVIGKIVSQQKNDHLNIITYTLSNGVKVLLKPTNFKNNEISFSGFAPGGVSLYSDADYQSAVVSANLITAGGIGNYNSGELQKFLSDKKAQVVPYISERTQGVAGASTVKDLETALQLVYGYFTEPRKDSLIFEGIISRSKAALNNRSNAPASVFQDTVSAVLGNYNFRRTGPSLAKLAQISLTKAYTIYKERFADASNFTFTFVGNIDTNTIKPLLEKYLGGLPTTYKKEQARDLDIHIPEGTITKTVYKGSEPKANVNLIFSGDFDYDQENKINLEALKEVLEIQLLERLREGESGVYSPGVSVNATKYPKKRYSIAISFGCSPQNVDKLISSTLDEISKLKSNGPSETNVTKFKAEENSIREIALKTNSFWLGYLTGQLQNKSNIEEILDYNTDLEKVNPESIEKVARKYLSGNNLIRLILMPEISKP